MNPEYILMTGAPGSKWSSVFKNIYWSDDVNHSDYKPNRLYFHDADTPGTPHLMHIGAYWDPGMEFEPDDWDSPFTLENPRKTKIIKSHVFAHSLDILKEKGYPIVLVYRGDVECLDWWKLCGEFNITYPDYSGYYKNLDDMKIHIENQNADILKFIADNPVTEVYNNVEACELLGIRPPSRNHNYKEKDIKVYVYK